MLSSLCCSLWHLTAAAAVLMFALLYATQPSVVAASTAPTAMASLATQSAATSAARNVASSWQGVAVAGAAAARKELQGAAVIAAVPKEARGSFIRYQLALAFYGGEEQHSRAAQPEAIGVTAVSGREMATLKTVPVYDDFASDLLQWVRQTFNSSDAEIQRLLRGERTLLCTAQGTCYNPGDISCLCCPF